MLATAAGCDLRRLRFVKDAGLRASFVVVWVFGCIDNLAISAGRIHSKLF